MRTSRQLEQRTRPNPVYLQISELDSSRIRREMKIRRCLASQIVQVDPLRNADMGSIKVGPELIGLYPLAICIIEVHHSARLGYLDYSDGFGPLMREQPLHLNIELFVTDDNNNVNCKVQ